MNIIWTEIVLVELIWILSSIVLGIGLGVLGYFFSKIAYTAFTSSMSLFLIFSGTIASKLGVERPNGGLKLPRGEATDETSIAVANPMFRAIDNMGMLPQYVQLSIVSFVVMFFLARIGTWAYLKFYPQTKAVESKADRKTRVLAQYGYKDGQLPY